MSAHRTHAPAHPRSPADPSEQVGQLAGHGLHLHLHNDRHLGHPAGEKLDGAMGVYLWGGDGGRFQRLLDRPIILNAALFPVQRGQPTAVSVLGPAHTVQWWLAAGKRLNHRAHLQRRLLVLASHSAHRLPSPNGKRAMLLDHSPATVFPPSNLPSGERGGSAGQLYRGVDSNGAGGEARPCRQAQPRAGTHPHPRSTGKV